MKRQAGPGGLSDSVREVDIKVPHGVTVFYEDNAITLRDQETMMFIRYYNIFTKEVPSYPCDLIPYSTSSFSYSYKDSAVHIIISTFL